MQLGRPRAAAFSAAAETLFLTAVAHAQAPVAPPQDQATIRAALNLDRSLQPLLEMTAWDPAQRGPLLIVGPETTCRFATGDDPSKMDRSLSVGRSGFRNPDRRAATDSGISVSSLDDRHGPSAKA